MRILMTSDVYFPRINGVSTSIETFRKTLTPYGVETLLVAPRYGAEPEETGIIRVKGSALPFSIDVEDRRLSWRKVRRAALEAARHCDLIHTHTPFIAHYAGLNAARKLRRPILTTYHTLFEEYLQYYVPFLPRRNLSEWTRKFSRKQCNAMNAVIVPSTAMREHLEAFGVTVPIHVLPTGIPLDRFASGDRRAFRARHGIAEERPVALFAGRIAHEKNIGFLLDAWAKAARARPGLLLLLAGDGPALAEYKAAAQRLGIGDAARFLGYLDRKQELPDCYAAADVFLFSSRTETQGLVLLEAMAAGLPVIGLSYLGTRDILEPGKGCLTPPEDEAAFAEAITRFFADPALQERLRAEARVFAQAWSDEACAARLAALYRSLL
ncbi:MAG: glycosyltransferase [Zoogloeaceae bacterium]|jgi:glycosyltransferase involved in cell wall biosynthesis|nr:glycosyltransferase [Zoogloeaceae bacterium]